MQKIQAARDAARRHGILASQTITRLQRGHVVQFLDGEYLITYVNDCRAVAIPRARRTVKIRALGGRQVTFSAPGVSLNISPNSECEIVGVDHDWLRKQASLAEKEGGAK